ncbi:MAG: hypothetical protein HRT90_01745 [Candidatus Margulisbacteria bacterium]|nr:hypothetical protein [Candidatus Margulisiibacteriota bacterium]
MGSGKKVVVKKEKSTGRNETFWDTSTSIKMTRAVFVKEIESNNYPDYHVRVINGIKTPASNPDSKSVNNLG